MLKNCFVVLNQSIYICEIIISFDLDDSVYRTNYRYPESTESCKEAEYKWDSIKIAGDHILSMT